MKTLKSTLIISAMALFIAACGYKDNMKWPTATGVITGKGDNGRIGKGHTPHWDVKFKAQDGKEYTGEYQAETTFTTTDIGDSVTFHYDPKNPVHLIDEDTYKQMQSQN
ncbi:DUF3592 domain-containing protein [Pedobacter sp. MC2016-24]|uniref:DUF3592 domain-containing protein n=1 Tax=Pedobacter sp. MC2016-24 TaxID=2780090 RepID=UPI00187E0C45|nr:DUF3592 domain-containing protein [Pedobacter sp. MC2016-24]MBE9601442.1 hypothetical protein [Pedobacter sp. MC2016-24]